MSKKQAEPSHIRLRIVIGMLYFGFSLITLRLFYWQIIKSQSLTAQAQDQYESSIVHQGSRGTIYTSDGYILAGNQTVYRLFAEPYKIEEDPQSIARQITPLLLPELNEYQKATEAAVLETLAEEYELRVENKLAKNELRWTALATKISEETKQKIEKFNIAGLGFDPYEARYYPEASMAAHVVGFVGKNEEGEETGYFGIEGALNKELAGRQQRSIFQKGILGFLSASNKEENEGLQDGRDVVTTIRRDVQHLLEEQLAYGLERYGAKAGEIIVMEPSSGKIWGLATLPHYAPATFYDFDSELYKNPSVSSAYEPGSTFKVLTIAAGIDTGAIKPETSCTRCDGPRKIDKYTIRTWNDEYNPAITMTDGLAQSDNTAMIFAMEETGKDAFIEYIKKFKIGEATTPDLQEDTGTPFPQKLGPVELATISFGQGISTTSLQMLRALASIAHNGIMMQPTLVEKVIDRTKNKTIDVPPLELGRTITEDSADTVTAMMVAAAEHGEAQWVASKTHSVAGKTSTAQVAVDGAYDENKTITSYIGFSPAENPKFVMLVKLVEPQTSPWAAETAAPLWYRTAQKLYLLLEVPPTKHQQP